MNRMQWEAAIHRLRQMEERLLEGSFDRLALEQARKAAQSKIPVSKCSGGGKFCKTAYKTPETLPLRRGSGKTQPVQICSGNKHNGAAMA